MTKQEFQKLVKSNPIFLDGATGSNLIKEGMTSGVCPEQWILDNGQVLVKLQKEYVAAGSHIIYAPTFTANRIKLEDFGLEGTLSEINYQLVALSKEAAGDKAFVAGDITMTGQLLKPMGTMELEQLITIYKEQISCLVEAGVDLLVVETMMSLQECRAALIAAKEVCELPVMVTMTFEKDGRSLYGTDAKTAAVVLSSLGAAAIGANCSSGPKEMVRIIREMRKVTNLPLIAKPNAGIPTLGQDGTTEYNMDSPTFTNQMKEVLEAGASILGGCCGTTPAYMKQLKEQLGQCVFPNKTLDSTRFLSSERSTLSFGLEEQFIIVGERINPTGKKKLQEQLRQDQLDLVISFAQEQEEQGAKILDINMGMSGIEEKEMMLKVIKEVGSVTSLPLAIDSSHVDVIEAALRHYPGRALINSISLEKGKVDQLLPLAKKYGAMFILLPLSDAGLPKNLNEKKDIIHNIFEQALALGLTKEDIVVDGLVTTVGANKLAALETLETIRYCKQLGLATICGLSNISFGLPERSYINAAFLTMAIGAGLTMAIANPSQQLLVSAALASDVLLNKENSDVVYINAMNELKEKENGTSIEPLEIGTKKEKSILELVYDDVLKGNRKQIVERTKAALQANMSASEILNEILLPAINQVGDLFDKGKYFLPQLIASAETMKLAIEYLEPMLIKDNNQKDMPTVVIATVEGDIHDIGKNLVALMLKNYGFKVFDLGKDVSKETIIEAAITHKADIIALSALMTTTMQQMKRVVDYAKEKNVYAKILIGGAVITEEYSVEIGADGYSKDAAEAVKLAQRVLNILEK